MRGGDQLPLIAPLADYIIRHHYPHLEGVRLLFESLNTLICSLPGGNISWT